jgi:cysteine desulfurase / selenocysteine lyase
VRSDLAPPTGSSGEDAASDGVYLDYAATAALRPPAVADAVSGYLREIGATPGRSGHARALAAGRVALRCRRLLAQLFAIPGDPGRIAFQLNATHALNTALHGTLSSGDRLVRTIYDHNAVRRPAAALAMAGVEERVLWLDPAGRPDPAQLEACLTGGGRRARLLALPHASNVTGAVLPVRELAERARAAGALVLLDAAQTAGQLPIDVDELGIDLLAFTGHKGLLGPQGIGGLWVREGVEVRPLLRGGSGGDSGPLEMPADYPDHLEAGTQNAPGMAGLSAGLEWVLGRGVDAIRAAEAELRRRLVAGLAALPGVRLCSPADGEVIGIATLLVDGIEPGTLATVLERDFGIQGRAGLHCAPGAHEALGTLATGAFRLSLGWATTPEEIERTIAGFRALLAGGRDR